MKKRKSDTESKKDNGKLIIIIILLLIIIALSAIIVSIILVTRRNNGNNGILPPDYAPEDTEINMETDKINGDETKLPQAEGSGAVSITYSTDVKIDLSEEKATLLVGNPIKSNKDMVVQLIIQDNVIIQTGRITPGHKVKTVSLADGAVNLLKPGGYDGHFMFYYYDPVTGEKAMVNTNIPVKITVKK